MKIMAAQILSQSCPNSRNALLQLRAIQDNIFVQILRLRLGIPPEYPPTGTHKHKCGCWTQDVTNQKEPLHSLSCKQSGTAWSQQYRHDAIVDTLQKSIRGIPGVTTCRKEPSLKSTQNQNTNKRADLKVAVRGKTVMIDVMITNPATSTKVNTEQSDLKPGITAARAYKVKHYETDYQVPYYQEYF